MAGGEATSQEDALVPIHRNGRVEEVFWTYSYGPIHDADAPNGVGGVLALITETTRSVVAQRESQDRYHMFFEALDQGFCVVDVVFGEGDHRADYVFVEANSAFEAQTGLRDVTGRLRSWHRHPVPGLRAGTGARQRHELVCQSLSVEHEGGFAHDAEVSEVLVAYEPVETAFPLHTRMVGKFFRQTL